jgi:hypothetical protein
MLPSDDMSGGSVARYAHVQRRRNDLLAWLRSFEANRVSTVSIARLSLRRDGEPIYFGRHADEGHATAMRDLRELENLGFVRKSQNYNGPAYWTVLDVA